MAADKFKKAYYRHAALCVVLAVLTLTFNILCFCLRSDENYDLMLWLNVISDALGGIFLVYYICCHVSPRKQLYILSRRKGERLQGVIDRVEEQSVRYDKLNCFPVYIGRRQLFLPENVDLPADGQPVSLRVVNNVILEAEL